MSSYLKESVQEKFQRETLAMIPTYWIKSEDLAERMGISQLAASSKLIALSKAGKLRKRTRAGSRTMWEYRKFL